MLSNVLPLHSHANNRFAQQTRETQKSNSGHTAVSLTHTPENVNKRVSLVKSSKVSPRSTLA